MRRSSTPTYRAGSFSYSSQGNSSSPWDVPVKRISAFDYSSYSQRTDEVEASYNVEWPSILKTLESVINEKTTGGFSLATTKIDELCSNEENVPLITEGLEAFFQSYSALLVDKLKNCEKLEEIIDISNKHKKKVFIIKSIFQSWEKSENQENSIQKILSFSLKNFIKDDAELHEKASTLISHAFTESRANIESFREEFQIIFTFAQSTDTIDRLTETLLNEETSYLSSNPIDTGSGPLLFVMNAKKALKDELNHISVFPQVVRKPLESVVRKKIYIDYLMFSMQRVIETIIIEKPPFIGFLRELCEESEDEKLISLFQNYLQGAIRDRASTLLKQNQSSSIAQLSELLQMLKLNREEFGSVYQLSIKQFRDVVNESAFQTAFMIAKFVHTKIIENTTDFMATKSRIIELLQMLESTDIFLDYHRRFLGQRLIASSTLPDAETSILKDLSQFAKFGELDPLYSMINDIALSQKYNEEFDAKKSFPFSVFVIGAYSWPQYPFVDLVLPAEVQEARQSFEDYFHSSFSSKRNLRWMNSLESCTFTYRKVTFKAASLQFVVFSAVLTNTGSNNDLKEITGIPSRYLVDILNQLVKFGLVAKKNGKYVAAPFKATKSSVKLPQLSMIAAKQKKERPVEDIFQGRKESIRTSITCSLKKWGELPFDALYEETKQSFRFLLSENDFRNFLDELIATDIIVKGTNGKYRFCV